MLLLHKTKPYPLIVHVSNTAFAQASREFHQDKGDLARKCFVSVRNTHRHGISKNRIASSAGVGTVVSRLPVEEHRMLEQEAVG